MNCIIVDDEKIAREGLAGYIEKTNFLTLSHQCANSIEAIEVLTSQPIDLVFLDINMPQLTGIDLLKSLPNPPMVIFTTAYAKYALEGFELNAVDYLVKPILYPRFLQACHKAYELFNLRSQSIQTTENPQNGFLYVKVDKKLVKVNFQDILYIESLKDYIRIHTKLQQCLIAYLNLKSLKEFLPTELFLQIHKSYLVAIDSIKAVYGNVIELSGKELPIGRQYKTLLHEKLIKNHLITKNR